MQQQSETAGKTIRCKAAVAVAPNQPLQVMEICVAPPKENEVRVKVLANALCHTDVYTLSGGDPEGKFPSILGHEATAVVESVGVGVTEYNVGDLVIPCYTPECQEWDCTFCNSQQTNLCPKVRASQGVGLMPDGTSRFSTPDGQTIWHFMGCSTFSEYTVLCSISLAKINPNSDPMQMCMLGCGVSTGWGAVMNNPNFKAGSSVAVWGLGAVGLTVIQAAKMRGATRIYGLDLNEGKFEVAKTFGATNCHNPLKGNSGDWLKKFEKWGIDFTFDCTGNVQVMRDALEASSRGYGESTVIGVAAAGKTLETRPFQLITGRVWKGTAFGGWKSRQDVPKLVNKVLVGELPIGEYVTHTMNGLDKVNELIDLLHEGQCLRGVIQIANELPQKTNKDSIKVLSSVKVAGGILKEVEHWSEACQCTMKFHIFLPEDDIKMQRGAPYPALYFLAGLGSSHENAPMKSGFAPHARKHRIAMIFPDTSPRNVDSIKQSDPENWHIGNSAGHYCDATEEPWNKNFNMYTYVAQELPEFVQRYFPISSERRGISGFSMGGGGALMIAARNTKRYRSVTAFAPISSPVGSGFCKSAIKEYFGEDDSKLANFDTCHVIARNSSENADFKMPPGFVDFASEDAFQKDLMPEELIKVLGMTGQNKQIEVKMREGYNHSYWFVSSFIEDHISHHAAKMYA